MKTFKQFLELKKSPFYGAVNKKITKEELSKLPIWDIEGGIGDREHRDTLTEENNESDDEVHRIHEHKREPNKDELNSIKHYSDYSYKINSDSKKGIINEHHEHLDSWLNEAKSKDDSFLYHGLKSHPHFNDNETNSFNLNSYMSSSSNKNVAKARFAKAVKSEDPAHHTRHHVLKILVPKNSKTASIQKYSESPEEQEVLIHRKHVLEVHHTPTIEGNTVYWHATLHNV